jgi:tripartite ATP-independent transporter DctM subunit
LFPPSLPVILYGLVAQVSIDRLFLAGLVPGIILILFLAGYSLYVGKKAKVPRIPFTWKNVWAASREAAWEIPLPIVVVGGIYGGFFTATEAAAVTAFYVVLVEVFIVRDIHWVRDLPRVMRESMILVGATLSILGIAFGLTNYLVDQQIPQWLLSVVETRITSQLTFLLILNVFLLVIGMIMEMFPAILVVVPLILPIAQRFEVNPLHLGIIFLTNLEVAYLVPPFGLNLFLSSLRFHRPVLGIARAVFMFLLLEIIALLFITYVPQFSLGLLNVLGLN